MKYYLDTEFNGPGGSLISLALVREDLEWVSVVLGCDDPTDWVRDHVMPNLAAGKVSHSGQISRQDAARAVISFIAADPDPCVIANWPDDIAHLCGLLTEDHALTEMLVALTFTWAPVQPYPTVLPDAVRHNAFWDAMALRACLLPAEVTGTIA